jgi:hypothetical protein
MDRNNMYRSPASPSSVIKNLMQGSRIPGMPVPTRPVTVQPMMRKPYVNNNTQDIYREKGAAAGSPRVEVRKDIKIDMNMPQTLKKAEIAEAAITQERLKEAIVWSEILGKPLCKRGKRRRSWQ